MCMQVAAGWCWPVLSQGSRLGNACATVVFRKVPISSLAALFLLLRGALPHKSTSLFESEMLKIKWEEDS